jgi:hypothetical protein
MYIGDLCYVNASFMTWKMFFFSIGQFEIAPTFANPTLVHFALDHIAIEGLYAKLWAPKVTWVPMVGILGLPLGSLGTKSHLDVASVERCRVYYKGEGGGFPQVQAVVSLVSSSCSWFVLAPKVLQLCSNHFLLACAGPCERLKLVKFS